MKLIASLGIYLALIVLTVAPAHAAKRVALLVGNSNYQHTPVLPNPKNDAADMAAALERLGFEVQLGIDLDQRSFANAVRTFARKVKGADTSLFFYAGHGLQFEGKNFLAPIDARLIDEADLTFETLDLNNVLRLMERASEVSLVFLDACRDNPLARRLAGRLGPNRSAAIGRGLAVVENVIGTLIVFATQPGNVAQDGDGRNSPFTKALLKHVEKPGLDISQLLRLVRSDVIADTRGLQVPWDHSSLEGGAYYLSPPSPTTKTNVNNEASISFTADQDVTFWETIRESGNVEFYREYLRTFPSGAFSGLARMKIAELTPGSAVAEQTNQLATQEQTKSSSQEAALTEPNFEPTRVFEEDEKGRDGRWQALDKDWHATALVQGENIEIEVVHDLYGRFRGRGSISARGEVNAMLKSSFGGINTAWVSGSLKKLKFKGEKNLGAGGATFVFRRVKEASSSQNSHGSLDSGAGNWD